MGDINQKLDNFEKRLEDLEAKVSNPQFIKSEYARLAGSKTSERKKISSAINGRLGGKPKQLE